MKCNIKNIITTFLILTFVLGFALFANADEKLDKLLAQVKEHHKDVTGVSADFTQTTMVKTLGREQSKTGKVYFKLPDKMRWDYLTPENQQIISDGQVMWFYKPDEKTAFKQGVSNSSATIASVEILAGKVDVEKHFNATLGKSENELSALILHPKQDLGYEKAVLFVDGKTGAIKKIRVYDLYGNITTLDLTNVELSGKIPDDKFTFTPPKGVTVEQPPSF